MPRNLRKELTLGPHRVTHTVLEWEWTLPSKCFVGSKREENDCFYSEMDIQRPSISLQTLIIVCLFCLAEKSPKF